LAGAACVACTAWTQSGGTLRRREHRPQRCRSGAVLLPLEPQRDHLVHPRAMAETVAQLVVGRAEARGQHEAAEPAHGLVSIPARYHWALIDWIEAGRWPGEDWLAERRRPGGGAG